MRPLVLATLALGLIFGVTGHANAQDGLEGGPKLDSPAVVRAPSAPAGPNVDLAKKFYDAYCSGDMATLESLYAPDAKWSDPITSFDDRAGTMGMWRALSTQGAKYSYSIVSAEGDQVVVNWKADYKLFGNPIHNDVMATLVFKDGKVVQHTDSYSWDKWASQAFPALKSIVGSQPAAWVLQHSLGAALHAQSALANAKLLGSEIKAEIEHGFSEKVQGALGH